MDDVIKPPYPGHGTAIPPEMGKGEWIIENLIYLTFNGDDPGPPPPTGRIDLGAVLPGPSGGKLVRFNAAQVAGAMGITVQELRQANRDGKLLVDVWTVPPRPGDVSARRFRLSFGSRYFEITMGLSRLAGRA